MKVVAEKLPTLRQWFEEQVGLGRKFGSLREMSLEAGLSDQTARDIYNTGRFDVESLLKLAEAAGENKLRVLVIAGVLPEDMLPKDNCEHCC